MQHRFQMPAWETRDGHSHGPSPHMPLRCHHGAITPPCTPLMCYCGSAASHSMSTMPKVASAVSIPSYAWSSHSSEGMAWASLDEDDALEDDFQTPHTPVHCVVQQEDDGCRSPAKGRPESPEEAQGSKQSTKQTLVRKGTCWRWLTLLGGPTAGFSWLSRASHMTRCPGTNLSYH